MEEKLIVALEIGSSKVKGAIGSVDPAGTVTVNAVEEEKIIDSVRYGLIRNVAEVADAVSAVIKRLEARKPGYKVTGVYVALGGRSLRSDVIEAERRLPGEMEITQAMIEDLFSDALSRQLDDRKIIDVTPREFRIDNAPTIRPVGTYGHHLEAKLNIISLRSQIWNNLNLVINKRLGLKINGFYVRQLAEADLVLTSEEKRLGCVFVDFGAETTTVSVYKHGVLQYLSTVPLGSRNITRDICALNHLEEHAEELKIRGGNAQPSAEQSAAGAYVSGGQDYTEVNNYISARAGEIIANIAERIKAAGFNPDQLPADIVIVGRGALLTNFNQRLGADTGMKVRAGHPGTRIRVNDSRITPADAIDVIATLAMAARHAEPCMVKEKEEPVIFVETELTTAPETVTETVEETVVVTEPVRPAEPARPVKPAVPVTPEPEPEPEKPKRPGMFDKAFAVIKDRVANLFTEPDEDDEDDDK